MAPPPPPSSLSFSVRRCKPELLTPAKPMPRELKQLSDVDDQQGHRCHIRIIMFYKNRIKETEHHHHHHVDPVSVIREAMAKALVVYYPLAGRLIEKPNKELTMDCTGQGILLVEADANVSLDQLGDFVRPSCPYAKEFLYDVPGPGGITECPLLLVHITRLSCGGFVLVIRLNHTVSDELGLVQLLKATVDMAKGSSSSPPRPVWQRELLKAREPPQITCALHHQYEDSGDHQSTTSMDMSDNNDTLHQSFFFGTKQRTAIFNHLPPPHLFHSSSTLQVLTAFLWRNGDGEDGIVVPICLPVAAMERFKVKLWRMTPGLMGIHML
ncbi:Methanol O-anthraniloyltransferase [Camellia lanceoleosa]|uniref:Methanol O-anthraniloyltransferase n=1 Tax=Camellia lanceoleosa TaxID=1840588 RepID=A0ACC0FGP2_9ERIC|nr:Methanol O-anthraniloyltransferase [Camellia lanceoleosa]